jgi:hypothetical protein
VTLSRVVLMAALGAGGVLPPKVAPESEWVDADVAVVVATSQPGDNLPAPAECDRPDTICLRYPLWFRIDVLRTVYGQLPARRIFVSTYTHYGQPEADDAATPRLLLLLSHGGDTLMPANAAARVWRRDDGEYFLSVTSSGPVWWLPCEAAQLREEIDVRNLPADFRYETDDYAVRENPGLFVLRDDHAVPKYAISVRRLGEWLANRRPRPEEFDCSPEEPAPAPREGE